MSISVIEREGLLEQLQAWLEQEPSVQFAYLYGSRARGYGRSDSDIDIAAYFAPDQDDAPEMSLEERLSRNLGLQVQVINLSKQPDSEFFSQLRTGVVLLKDSPKRAQWEKETGRAMSEEQPGTLQDYLLFVLNSMEEKSAKLREAAPLLGEVDLGQVKRGDLKVVSSFLGAFFMVFEPLEALARRIANYVHLTASEAVPSDLKDQIQLLVTQVGLEPARAVPLKRFATVRNKLAHAYWNLNEQELNNDDIREGCHTLDELTLRVDSFVVAARGKLHEG